jgi:mono/diheme cytochrome c family protein
MVLGGEEIDAETLNEGRTAYTLYCYACHGHDGDGQGPASYGYWPPPRDFRQATFKFGGVPEGELPADEDLIRLVHNGLTGTAMLPWEISHEEAWLAVQYIKTFSPEGKGYRHPRKKPAGPKIPDDPFLVIPRTARWDESDLDDWIEAQRAAGAQIPSDPQGLEAWKKSKRAEAEAKRQQAIAAGEKQYHAGGCQLCHSAYVAPEKIIEMGGTPRAVYPWDPDPKFSATYGVVLVPPDFLRHPVRAAKRYHDDKGNLRYDALDFYRVIASGIPGTAMPSWAALPPEQVWAVAYYVANLAELRDTAEAASLRASLLALPEWKPPAEPPPPAEAPPAEGAAPAAPTGGTP